MPYQSHPYHPVADAYQGIIPPSYACANQSTSMRLPCQPVRYPYGHSQSSAYQSRLAPSPADLCRALLFRSLALHINACAHQSSSTHCHHLALRRCGPLSFTTPVRCHGQAGPGSASPFLRLPQSCHSLPSHCIPLLHLSKSALRFALASQRLALSSPINAIQCRCGAVPCRIMPLQCDLTHRSVIALRSRALLSPVWSLPITAPASNAAITAQRGMSWQYRITSRSTPSRSIRHQAFCRLQSFGLSFHRRLCAGGISADAAR